MSKVQSKIEQHQEAIKWKWKLEEMAQQLRVFVVLPEDSSFHTYMFEMKRQLQNSSAFCLASIPLPTHVHTYEIIK